MSASATAISNLLYRYAELMDAGELEQVAELLKHARVKSRGGIKNHIQMLEQ